MRISRFKLPSPALVVSSIALVVALGGTSYAALNLPKNSVGTKQLKKNAVTTKKISNGAVTRAKLNLKGVTVPNAKHANTADSANTANTANSAANAANLTGAGWGTVTGTSTAPFVVNAHNASVTRVANGEWCISVPGTSASTTPITLGQDFENDATVISPTTGKTTGVEWDRANTFVSCPAGQYAVITYGVAKGTGSGFLTALGDASFTFFVP